MNSRRICFAAVALSMVSHVGATAPAPSPNFCSHGLCLEISQLTGKNVSVKTALKEGQVEVSVGHPSGVVHLVYSNAGMNDCRAMRPVEIRKTGSKYAGSGCLALPGQAGKWMRVSLSFTPANDQAFVNFPILHLWSVDTSPASFWESGYALRIGEGQQIRFSSHTRR